MKKALLLLLLLIAAFTGCKRQIPDPPLNDQVNGVPAGTGPCTVSFYSTAPGRTYDLTVDGTWTAYLGGPTMNPSCGDFGTATFHLSAGSHTLSYTSFSAAGSTSGSITFTLSSTNCVLYQL